MSQQVTRNGPILRSDSRQHERMVCLSQEIKNEADFETNLAPLSQVENGTNIPTRQLEKGTKIPRRYFGTNIPK